MWNTKEDESSSTISSPVLQKDDDLENDDDHRYANSTTFMEEKGNYQDSSNDLGHGIEHYKQKIEILKKEVLSARIKPK